MKADIKILNGFKATIDTLYNSAPEEYKGRPIIKDLYRFIGEDHFELSSEIDNLSYMLHYNSKDVNNMLLKYLCEKMGVKPSEANISISKPILNSRELITGDAYDFNFNIAYIDDNTNGLKMMFDMATISGKTLTLMMNIEAVILHGFDAYKSFLYKN